MTGWSVMLRSIRYRSGRSLVVLLLAAFATLATVLAPAYGRAAQQSVLTDAMRSAPQTAAALTIGAESSAAGAQGGAFDPAQQSVAEAKLLVDGALAKTPHLAAILDRPVTAVETGVNLGELEALLAWRLGACARLEVTGSCAIDADQAVLSERSAAEAGVSVGDTITVVPGRGQGSRRLDVVGLYRPKDSSDVYWGDSAYFAHAPGARLDAIFTGTEDDVRIAGAVGVAAKLTYPVKPEAVRLDAMPALRSELGTLGLDLNAAELQLQTALLSIADDVASDHSALARSVPLVAVPLVLLAFVVLFLIVAALTEERGPELALARLRGFPAARAARFGLGETLLLIVLGAPIGLAAGIGVVELAARTVLAEGTHVEPRWPVFAAAGAALAFACVAAWLATRRTFASGVLDLLRRVPERRTRRAGIVEGAVATLAAVGLVAALQDRGGPFALLVPAAFALLAGLIAGRLLVWWARLRLVIARRSGNVAGLLAAAQLARRPGSARMAVVLTGAVALLAFAAAAWDVAARSRMQHAQDVLGAAAVYQVDAAHPQALIDAVAAADPSGKAMAVVRTDEQYAQERVELIGVQSGQLGEVAIWRGKDRGELTRLGEELRQGAPRPAAVDGDLVVRVMVTSLSEVPMRLGAVISDAGQPPRVAWLGDLRAGQRDYAIALPDCTSCRFAGLTVARAGGLTGAIRAVLTLHEVRSGGAAIATDQGTWRVAADRNPSARVSVDEGTLTIESTSPADVTVSYVDTPARLPVVLAGVAPGAGDTFTFPAFADTQQEFEVIERTELLPRAGGNGLLFDLDLAVRSASVTAGLADAADLRYEVWASGDAPAGLAAKLADQGVRVWGTRTVNEEIEQLGRRAPALSFRLYLLAGIAAAALGLGVVALSRRIGAGERRAELAALRATGVKARTLRRAMRRERLASLLAPLVLGLAAGIGAAALMLPGIPLVRADTVASIDLWTVPGLSALPIAMAAAVVIIVSRLLPVRGIP